MIKRTAFLLFVCLLLAIFNCFAQSSSAVTDSLLNQLKISKQDTSEVNVLNDISWQYRNSGDYPNAILYFTKAEALAKKISFKKGLAKALVTRGVIYMDHGDYAKALEYYLPSLQLREEIGDKKGVSSVLNNIGIVYQNQSNYAKALEYHFRALNIREEMNDKKGEASSYINIGNIYKTLGDTPKSLEYYLIALKKYEEAGEKIGIAACLNNIGIIYEYQDDFTKALEYYFLSIKTNEEVGNKGGVASAFNNIGFIYQRQNNYAKALEYYERSLTIMDETGNKMGAIASLNNIGFIHQQKGNFQKALEYNVRSLEIAEQLDDKLSVARSFINLSYTYLGLENEELAMDYGLKALTFANEINALDLIKEANLALSNIYTKTGKHEKALVYYKAFVSARDSLFNEDNTKKMAQSAIKFEYEKKEQSAKLEQEKKDAIAKEEQEKQKVIRNSFIGGFVLLLLLSGVIFRSYSNKKKANELISYQKHEVEKQKHIVEEKHKEITDSINYAERIQKSFLATSDLLDVNLNDYFVLFQPKDVVSGDFYWASKLSNGNFALVTADSTGHGVPGAIMSILNISSLEKAVEQGAYEPAEILNQTRNHIIQRLKKDGSAEGGKDGMDCSLIRFDFEGNKLTYSAANNPIWIVRSDSGVTELIELSPDKMPVGKHDKDSIPFTQHEFQLQKHDVVYALTDGFPDQFGGPRGKKFMYKQMKEVLKSKAGLPMSEQKQQLQNILQNWKGNLEQVDDVCVIGIRI